MKEAYGDEAEVMMAALAENGKMTSDQLVNHVVTFAGGAGHDAPDLEQVQHSAQATLDKMIAAGFLMKEEFTLVDDTNAGADDYEREAPVAASDGMSGKRRKAGDNTPTSSIKTEPNAFAIKQEDASPAAAGTPSHTTVLASLTVYHQSCYVKTALFCSCGGSTGVTPVHIMLPHIVLLSLSPLPLST